MTESIRNVALLAHSGAGKTSLLEAMLYCAGARAKLGRVEDGTTASDYTPEEKERRTSVYTTVHPLTWQEHAFNLLDTPGYADFVGEIRGAQIAADAAIIVVSAVAGVEVGTERVWISSAKRELNRLIVINKLDRENADYYRTVADLEATLPGNVAAIALPIGEAENFCGTVDLLHLQAFEWDEGKPKAVPIPDELEGAVRDYRARLVEAIVETDDALMVQYLEGAEPDPDTLLEAFYAAVRRNELTPILVTSATKALGVAPLLDFMTGAVRHVEDHKPLPTARGEPPVLGPEGPFSARVFKTVIDPYMGKLSLLRVLSGSLKAGGTLLDTSRGLELRAAHLYTPNGKDLHEVAELSAGMIGVLTKQEGVVTGDTLAAKGQDLVLTPLRFPSPVMALSLSPKTQTDDDRLSGALHKLTDEDPTLAVERNTETHETVLWGMGHVHLELAVQKLKNRYGVEVATAKPKITYRETVAGTGEARYRHKKQSGGAGQFAEVALKVAPLARGAGFEFENAVTGGSIPAQFIPSCEKGVRGALRTGVLGGFQLVDLKATVYDGKDHPVDSKDIAFQIAAAHAFSEAVGRARPVLLEPVALVKVRVPEGVMGDVIGDLNTRRGRILGIDSEGAVNTISAHVPMAEIQSYSPDLHSLTGGRGVFSLKFDHYAEVPQSLSERLLAERQSEVA
jgi:elongation factor G